MTIPSRRLSALPPYIFTKLEAARRELVGQGRDVINLSVGDPDMGAPEFVVETLRQAAGEAAHHRYNCGKGRPELLGAAAEFMRRRFGVAADPEKHLLVLIGSKEGLAHLPLAVADPGDGMLIPDPSYPVYHNAAVFTGLTPIPMPLTESAGWLPDLNAVSEKDAASAALLMLNYPSNPTAACAPLAFFDDALRFGAATGTTVVSDQAYSEIYFDEADRPLSLWQAPSADLETSAAIEFHSLSKTFCMTGWRVAFAVGRPDIIAALAKVKATHDSGVFTPIQLAGAEALRRYDDPAIAGYRAEYGARRDALIPALQRAGLRIDPPRAGFFAWGQTPRGLSSAAFADRCLHEANVVVVPGDAFGPAGEGYYRVALTVGAERLSEAAERLAALDWAAATTG